MLDSIIQFVCSIPIYPDYKQNFTPILPYSGWQNFESHAAVVAIPHQTLSNDCINKGELFSTYLSYFIVSFVLLTCSQRLEDGFIALNIAQICIKYTYLLQFEV